jgi:imidazolonepropionase-like amidohydrolase
MAKTPHTFLFYVLAAVFCVHITSCAGRPINKNVSKSLALVNAMVIDGTGNEPLPDAVVLISKGRIAAVGERSKVKIPASADIIDVGGATILPGFINAHVHRSDDETTLKTWARNGVTTIRDLGNDRYPEIFRLRDRLRDNPETARLVAAGPIVTVPGGYPMGTKVGKDALAVVSAEDARIETNRLLDYGADLIKISLESFEGKAPVLSTEEARAIVETAHARGRRVSAHVTFSGDLEKALDAGVDDIAHMVTSRLPDDLIARAVNAGVYWVPTMHVWMRGTEGVQEIDPLQDPVVDNLSRFVAAGGRVAIGTDYGPPFNIEDFGMPLHEIDWLHTSGMTPMQIILAATKNAAAVCNVEKYTGTLEPGKMADVIVVEGDVLKDMHALGKIKIVIKNGTIIRLSHNETRRNPVTPSN